MQPTEPPGDSPAVPPSSPPQQPPAQPQPPYPYPYPSNQPYPYPYAAPYPYPYGYPPYPYGPAPEPPKRSNTALWVTLSILAGVIVLSCVGCGIALTLAARAVPTDVLNSAIGPEITATQFCVAEETGDYVGAYELFSTQLQGQMPQDQWTSANQARAQSNGAVRDCQVLSGSGSTTGGDTATVQIQLTLDDGEHVGLLSLVNEDDMWVIDAIDSGLELT